MYFALTSTFCGTGALANNGLNLTEYTERVGRLFGLHLTTAGRHVDPAG
jgi:hypothetical protein